MRRYQRLATLTHLLLLVMLVVNTFAPAILVNAQETTPDAPPPAETTPETTPVEVPTGIPTETPTETPVVIPTQNPPSAGSLFLADFNTGDTSAFFTTGDWTLMGDSLMLATSSLNATAIPNGLLWGDFILVTSVTVGAGGEAVIGLRAGAESYAVRISDSGNATLWRGETLLGGILAPVAETTPDPLAAPQQFDVAISVVGGAITVAVNNLTQINITDPAPLLAGYVVFGSSATNAGLVGYDNILIQAQVPVSNETPTTPEPTPIVIPPLDPTPENTPVVEVTEAPVESTEIPVESTEAPVESTEVPVEATEIPVELTPELTPDVELTPELTPDVELTPELTPEVTETPVPLTLAEIEIAKLQGNIWELLQAYYGGDIEGARAFADARHIQWREDDRLQVWVYPYAPENIPATAATLLELGGEVLYLADTHVDVIVSLDVIVELARDGRIFAVTLPVFAATAEESVQDLARPKVLGAPTGTGGLITASLDQLGISSWHEADILGAGVNIAVIDNGFLSPAGLVAEQTCYGSNNVLTPTGAAGGANGSSSRGRSIAELLCDIAPQADVWMYSANTLSEVATAINTARAGVPAQGFPPATVILVSVDLAGTDSALINAFDNAFNNNVPVIVSTGAGGSAKSNITFSFSAGGTTKVILSARDGDIITITPGVAGNATAINQIDGDYADTNAGTIPHQYTVGSECGTVCQLELTITRTSASATYTISSNWSQANIIPDNTVTVNSNISQLPTYAHQQNVMAVGAVCATQIGRFPLTTSSPQGASNQPNTPNIKPDLVAPAHVSTSINIGGVVNADYTCSGGVLGTAGSAAHVAGMSALLISNPNMFGINGVTSGRPWQVFSYLKSRALDVNNNGYDRGYGAGVAQLGDPSFNLQFERTLGNNVDRAGLNAGNTLYVSSDRLSDFNIFTTASIPTLSVPTGTISNPFTHLSHALQFALNNPAYTNIVLLPGEYPTSFIIPKDGLSIFGYDFADSGDHPASRVWVNDIINSGGLFVNNRSNITISGLEFYSATPDYTFTADVSKVARTSPIFVQGSTGITLTNNLFTNFDAPVQIWSSQNVILRENTFSNFSVLNTAQAAALIILTSGGTTPVAVERNLFTNNNIPDIAAENRNSIVFIDQSSARFYGNRLVSNTAASLVTINMWESYGLTQVTGRNTLFSNVFSNNTTTGPLVHIAQGVNFQFANNTVANHLFNTGNANLNAIFGLGRSTQNSADLSTYFGTGTSVHRFDVYNNVFFNNKNIGNTQPVLFGTASSVNHNIATCQTIDSNSSYARYNWFISTSIYQGNVCDNDPLTGAQGNILTVLNLADTNAIDTFTNANFFTTTNDPDHPYRLRPDATTNGVAFAFDPVASPPYLLDNLIVTGNASTEILTSKNPSTDTRALDALGNPRFVDQTDVTFNGIDYGAYELTEPDPVEFFNNSGGAYSNYNAGDFDFTFNEDGVATINMIRMVQKGFKPYTVEIVPNVTIYDTNPLNQCNGQPYLYDPVSYILTYCPPDNFHNQGITDPLAGISFDYRVTGLFNTGTIPAAGYATVTVKVNAVDDGNVTAATQRHGTDLVSTLQVSLRPRYDLDPLSFLDASGVDNLDYPFTFSNFTETSDPQNLLDGANIAALVSNGVFTYTPPPSAAQGIFEFTYRATDQDGDFATRTMRVRVVDRILTQGLHDNTALGIVYSGTWTPVFADTAYQKSLHSTTDTNASVRFNFTGNSFAIGYVGNGVNAGGVTIEIDPLGISSFNNVYATVGLTCTTVTPAAGNPISTAVSGRIIIRCSGIESIAPGEVHTVRINNDSANAFRLDWVQVDGQPLPVGMYEDTDLRPYLTGTTFTADAQSLNGSWEVLTNTTSQINFTVDASVKRMVIFRPINNTAWDLSVQLSGGTTCTARTVLVDSFVVGLFMWNQPYTIDLGGCLNVSITRTNEGGGTPVGVDRIELLGTEQPVGAGSYLARDLYQYFTGRNGLMPQSRVPSGFAQRLLSTVYDPFIFSVTPDVKYVTVYRDNYSARDQIRVTTLSCSNSGEAQVYNVPGTGPDSGPFEPFVVSLKSCSRVRFDRVPSAAAPVFDRIILSSSVSSGNLPIGYYDNLQLGNYFSSSAVLTPTSLAGAGSWHVLPTGASLAFTVDPSVKRLVIFRQLNTTADDLRVQASGGVGCTPINREVDSFLGATEWNQPFTINLNNCTNVIITKDGDAGSTTTGIDAIQLLGTETPLGPAIYHTKDLYDLFQGRNASLVQPRAEGGIGQRLLDTTPGVGFAFNVLSTVKTVVLYRDNYSVRDPINVFRTNCTTGADQTTLNFVNTGPDAGPFEPTVINMLSCTRLVITRQPIAAAPVFDRMILLEGLPGALQIGEYDNLELASLFTNATAVSNSAASDGSWHQFNAGGTLTFTVDPSVKRLVVFRPIDDVREDLVVAYSGGVGCTPGNITLDSFVVGAFMWNQPYTVNLNNCVNVIISRASTGATSPTGVDRIELLGAETPLAVGEYHTIDLYEYFTGRNAQLLDSRAEDGIGQRLLDTSQLAPFRFDVAPGTTRVVLYRQNYAARDPIRIRTSIGGSCVSKDYQAPNNGTDADFGFPIVIDLAGCTRISFDRVPIAAAPVLEQIVLLPAPAPTLTSGNLYEEYHTSLVYSGSWLEASIDAARLVPSRRLLYSNALNASVTFTVTGNGFIVYHRVASGASNNIEVCVTTGANPAVCTNYSTQSNTAIAQFPVGIYGLGSGTHTVTITNKHSGGNLFIDAIRVP